MKKKYDVLFDYSDFVNSIFSFRPLLKFWEKESQTNKAIAASFEYIKKKLDEAPELKEPITDFSIVEKYRELIDEMLSICIPPAIAKNDFYAAVYPDRHESFYETPAFKKLGLFDNKLNTECLNDNCCLTIDGRIIAAYVILLRMYYNLNVSYEYPVIFTTLDEKTGLEKHFRIRIYSWFSEIRTRGELKKLSEEETRRVFDNFDNPRVITEIIPPDPFETEGFFIYNAVEVTDQESLSSIKFDLIGKHPLSSVQKFENLQHKLRVLLKKPEIKLGLLAFPSEKKDIRHVIKLGRSIILQDELMDKDIMSDCKIYGDVIKNNETKLIYDLKEFTCSSVVEETLINSGVRNLLVAPLNYKGDLIGLLEVASSVPGDLNKINALKLKDVYPLFAMCIESSLDDLEKSVQSVIKEKCTAIHPSVEWRFREAAMKYINNLRSDIIEEIEDIVFENVNPFYACSDVRDSSINRNAAVKSDLIENLTLAKEIIAKISSGSSMPILEEHSFRISNQIELLNKEFSSNAELNAINFIRNEVSSTFEYLKDLNPDVENLLGSYRQTLCKDLGIISKKRKQFEESISLINEVISTELEIQQDKAQKIFPHYFEKHKTDGIEYTMYAGSSLVADRTFNLMHLKSLRLWQLVAMCIIAKRCIDLKSSLSIPLDMTHLIFVQNTPIGIKFFYDEKKFDVYGSYDIRYEIIKKRLDKALIKGSDERLTSPGKIAIVYSLESEAAEYRQYVEFLRAKKFIFGELESLELEDMQGVYGLRALRISVNKNFVLELAQNEKLFKEKFAQ